jgi:hypothetical protein
MLRSYRVGLILVFSLVLISGLPSVEAGSEVRLTIFREGGLLQRNVILAPRPQETGGREG